MNTQLQTWLIRVSAFHYRKNSKSQVRLEESSAFLHEYLIDARSKIAWRETVKIKERKTVTTEAGRRDKVWNAGWEN